MCRPPSSAEGKGGADTGNGMEPDACWKKKYAKGLMLGGGILVAAPFALPVAARAMGFGPAGIAANSLAARMMSAVAKASEGGVAKGSVVAVLQSIGAAGLGRAAATAKTVGVGLMATGVFFHKCGCPGAAPGATETDTGKPPIHGCVPSVLVGV
eukprot:GHVU01148251.1.p1 GENE.GHVU01148251.1~~GHVU01148251.1.p1  ORF type:complete len:155 (-),score=17.89 GHVU01148251.1:197-661(-)